MCNNQYALAIVTAFSIMVLGSAGHLSRIKVLVLEYDSSIAPTPSNPFSDSLISVADPDLYVFVIAIAVAALTIVTLPVLYVLRQ